jgi:hypothetical protein
VIKDSAANGYTEVELCIEDGALSDVLKHLTTNGLNSKSLGHAFACGRSNNGVSLVMVSGWTNDIQGE